MDIVLSIIAIFFSWRFLSCALISIAFAFLLGNYFGSVAAFASIFIGVGLGCIWQSRWLYGPPIPSSARSQSIPKPVAFFGYAFLGAIWGGLSSVLLEFILNATIFMVTAVVLAGTWLIAALRKTNQLNNLIFAAFSLFLGFAGILAMVTFYA
jgi:hypothetical protein